MVGDTNSRKNISMHVFTLGSGTLGFKSEVGSWVPKLKKIVAFYVGIGIYRSYKKLQVVCVDEGLF